jgi:hypothetical protein
MCIGYSWQRNQRKTKYRWVDNIKMDLAEIGWDDVDWSGLAQGAVMNLQLP